MVPTVVLVIAFLVLIVWRLVFTALQRRPLSGEISARNQLHNSFSEQHLNHHREERAKTYLRRIISLTGAMQMGNRYVLDVGKMRFSVRESRVGRVRDSTNPKCVYQETCFYSAHREIPEAEQIAAVLLQLKNNPALFEKWAA